MGGSASPFPVTGPGSRKGSIAVGGGDGANMIKADI